VAQSWRDAEKPITNPLDVNGSQIQLHGTAENIILANGSAKDGRVSEVTIRPIGTGILRIEQENVGNDETLLVVSKSPPSADPVLGFAGWTGPMLQNSLGMNRMPKGKTTVFGLPEGTVYYVMFAADNCPGFAADKAEIKPARTTTASTYFVASWSDARHDPPKRLKPLYKEIKKLSDEKDFSVRRFLNLKGIDFRSYQALSENLGTKITLPSGTITTVGDLAAVEGYLRLKKTEEERLKRFRRRTRRLEPASEAEEKVGYKEALSDLHHELGQNYPCFELKEIDWEAVGSELIPRAKNVTDDEEFGLLCMEMVARLRDSHAVLLKGRANPPRVEIPRWDPGFACLIDDFEKPVVYHVDKGSPADAAGVRPGMTVLKVGGVPVEKAIGIFMKQAAKYVGFSSRRLLAYQAARWFPRQMHKGDEITLEMEDPSGEVRRFELQAICPVRYLPRLPVPIQGISDSANVSWKMLEGNIGYIYVRRIRRDLIEQLDRAVEDLKNARGLIVDVRGNSGGGFDARRAHRSFNPNDKEEPDRPRFDGPMAVLIDASCISAGEGWASWFVANRRARFFGEATAGASARKKVYKLKNGLYNVRYPVKAYKGYLGRPIERRGLEPEVALRQSAKDLAAGRDTVLEAAKDFLIKQNAN
jgi:C-terminal processing protease CtpA/Prc